MTAIATDGTHTITILLNDGNGDFSERYDVWVSKNTSRNAEWDEFSNVQFLEVGDFAGDSAPDIMSSSATIHSRQMTTVLRVNRKLDHPRKRWMQQRFIHH